MRFENEKGIRETASNLIDSQWNNTFLLTNTYKHSHDHNGFTSDFRIT